MEMVEKKFVVTPWEVWGFVVYGRLIRGFGTQPISGGLAKRLESSLGDTAYLVRREIFFSHRDLNLVLDDYEKGKGFFLYTGRGPSGPMHIGHILSFYFTKWLQDKFHTTVYIQITDDEKFLEERSEEHTSELQSRFDLVCRLLLEKKKKKKKKNKINTNKKHTQ